MNKFMRLVAVLMVLATVFAFAACQPNEGTTASQNENPTTTAKPTTQPTTAPAAVIAFRVKVVDQDGNAVPGVWVQLCKDSCTYQMTNEEGWAEFPENAASGIKFEDGYKCNIGFMDNADDEAKYEYDPANVTYFESGKNEMTLTITRK